MLYGTSAQRGYQCHILSAGMIFHRTQHDALVTAAAAAAPGWNTIINIITTMV